jgi:hypothetical protein
MFSTVRLAAAAAIVALFSGFLLSGVITTQEDRSAAPAAATSEATAAPEATPMDIAALAAANQARWVRVSGTVECVELRPGDSEDEIGSISHTRGMAGECVATMSDERLSGTWHYTADADCFVVMPRVGVGEDDCLVWGTNTHDDPDAGWECSYAGSNDPDNQWAMLTHGVCTGTRANEGWSYVYHELHGDEGETFKDGTNARGVLYEGDPPPRGE